MFGTGLEAFVLVALLAGIVILVVLLVRSGSGRLSRSDAERFSLLETEQRHVELARAEAEDALRLAVSEAQQARLATEQAVRAAEQIRLEAAEVRSRADVDAARAREQAAADLSETRARAVLEAEALRAEVQADRDEVRAARADVERRERRLEEREQRIATDAARLDERATAMRGLEIDLDQRSEQVSAAQGQLASELERVANLSTAQARAEVVSGIEAQAKREAQRTVRTLEREAREEGDTRARKIITLAVQRLASEQTAESTVSVLHLPGDDMKGRIIGREGRNIRTFESVTGVNLIIDDTPEAVLLSSFDPVRREIARITLESLVADGRIQPQRIEEVYEKSRIEIEQRCVRAGEDALVELSVGDMHPDLIALLGRLRYRTSYGQNVLKHLVEAAHLAGMMAAELRLPIEHAKRCALLHDVGKALTHEVEGSHAIIGAEIARRYGEHEDVVHAVEAHHNEVEVRTLEAVLTQAADAISGSRPGARRESLEHYVERLHRLEEIAGGHEGVDRVFAMQAGREVRVAVLPDRIDDLGAQVLARDIAKEIESELTYPGQIRVTVVRESRATEIAR